MNILKVAVFYINLCNHQLILFTGNTEHTFDCYNYATVML